MLAICKWIIAIILMVTGRGSHPLQLSVQILRQPISPARLHTEKELFAWIQFTFKWIYITGLCPDVAEQWLHVPVGQLHVQAKALGGEARQTSGEAAQQLAGGSFGLNLSVSTGRMSLESLPSELSWATRCILSCSSIQDKGCPLFHQAVFQLVWEAELWQIF